MAKEVMFGTYEIAQRRAGLATRRAGLPAAKRAELERLLRKSDEVAVAVIPRRTEEGPSPLSFAQERLWFLDQLEPGSPLYNVPVVFRLTGPLRVSEFAQSLGEVVRRHESLRTRFVTMDETPLQVVAPDGSVDLAVVDFRDLAAPERESAARRMVLAEVERPFDLAAGPLLRVTLLLVGEEEHLLAVVMHHIVSDGWSLQVLIREVGTLYRAFAAGEPVALPELPVQYADYARWQRRWLQGEVLAAELAYWRRQLQDLPPVLQLPTDRPRPAQMSLRGETLRGRLPEGLTRGLKAFGQAQGATLFVVLMAAIQALLARYSGQQDVAVGTPVAGRRCVELEELIGFFVNTLVIRTRLAGDPSVRELLGRVREVVLEAQSHQDLPFEKLVEELRPERSLGHAPLFQVMFVFQNVPRTVLDVEGLSMSELDFDTSVERFDLTFAVAEQADQLAYLLSYSTDLFEAATARRLLGHFETLLAGLLADPEMSVSALPLLSEAERHQLAMGFNDTARDDLAGSCLHQLFERQAALTPDATAVVDREFCLTYRELGARASQLAWHLCGLGVGAEMPVGVLMERGAGLVVALLGVLAAGGAYVPLDPSYPEERVAYMLEDARVRVVVADRPPAWLAGGGARTVVLPRSWAFESAPLAGAAPSGCEQRQLAYLIYTSGSTGRPKGVAIEHRSAVTLVRWALEVFSPQELRGVLFATSICFDLSVFELFVPLSVGGTVVVASDALELPSLAAAGVVSLVNTVPSALRALLRRGPLPESVSAINLAGEPLPRDLAEQAYAQPGVQRVFNLYGPTEDTTYSTVSRVERGRAEAPTIGRPVAAAEVYIAGDHELQGLGMAGELLIGGAGLARGYLHLAELTAERFVPDPFAGRAGARLYRTGDLARVRADGEVEFLGRLDHQVKVRGFRIELGEIESVLRGHGSVGEAVVVAQQDHTGDPRLVAYVTGRLGRVPSAAELREYLRQRLPHYMIPQAFATLAALPLTRNGKVDRRALPSLTEPGHDAGQDLAALRTPIEEVVAAIWSEVLGLREVGRTDDFFGLGGHSLLATRVLSRVRQAFQVELPVRTLFETPTLAGLAERIDARRREVSGLATPPLRRRLGEADPPLSYAQQRLWFLAQLAPDSSAYSLPAAVELDVDLDVATLERCMSEVVRRHEVLRTTFVNTGGQPRQVIAAAAPVALPLIDLGRLPQELRRREVERLARDEALRPFDLSRGPLLHVSLLRLGERRHRLLLTMHHIVSDGWSMGVLSRELEAFYKAFASGLPSPLPELPVQYADYALWQREWLRGDLLAAELEHWRRQLAGVPAVLELGTDHPRPAVRTLSGASCPLALPASLSQALRELSRRQGATLFMTLMTALQALLGRYTGQDDVLVGTPIAGRSRVELEGMIGFFVNMVAIGGRLAGGPSFRQLLQQVRASALEAYTHQDLPFDKLVEELQPARSLGRNPLFQVILAFQNDFTPDAAMAGVTVLSGNTGSAETKFDLEVYLSDGGREGIAGSLVYSPELFEGATIRRMADHLTRLLERAVCNPDAGLFDCTLMGEVEGHHVITEWNDTAVEIPLNTCIHEVFEEQAERTPEALAVQSEAEQVTYRELNRRANRLAHALRKKGVGPEVFVGMLLERSVEMVVALLGIAKAGGVYVPLNVDDPARRISFILEDAGASVLVTTSRIAGELPRHELAVVCLDGNEMAFAGESEENPVRQATAENLVYMIYTSGSTGVPKGVCITHHNVVKLVKGADYADLDSRQVFLQLAPVSFDASTFEIWGCLLNGARLVLFPAEVPTLADLGDFLARSQVTTLWLTAGLFHQMVDENLAGLHTIRHLLAGGEPLSGPHANRVLDELAECRLINGYGPTETTTFACCYRVERERPGAAVPIGRPIANTRVYLLNQALCPAAIGERAELFIGGEGLARGYLGRPNLTAERFVPDPFGSEPGARLYGTGDVVRLNTRELVEFLGRMDHQVKVRGFRIELGEIEAALAEHPGVKEGVVVARQDTPGDRRLVAYAAADGASAPSSEALRAFLKERLPDYMVPSVCVILEALPLRPNGKVDRSALPAPDRALLRSERAFVAPRNALQRQLVEIWENLLGIRPIGVRDDFFELGGHSLLMVQLIARIEEQLGKRVSMADLLQGATIENLSELLHQDVQASSWSLLVPIQPHGSNPPLFCVHAAGGNVLFYADLARHLGEDQPFYGIQARDLNKDLTPHNRIETTAAEYVEAVRTFQPQGPYLLGGWSMGGVIAFEMARQMRQQGHEIALLALMDSEAPSGQPAEYTWVVLLGSFALNLGLAFDHLRASWDEIAALPPMGQLSRVAVEAKAAGLVPPDTTLAEFRKLFDAFKTKAQIMRSYAGGAYDGRITLFRAEQPQEYIGKELPANYYTNLKANPVQDGVDLRDPTTGWGKWASGGVDLYTVPGDHYSMVREPHVKLLADQVLACLRNAVKELV